MVVDLFLVYNFIRKLVTPFEKWEANKLGIIDDKGNILIKRKAFTKRAQRQAFGIFDLMILNLKKQVSFGTQIRKKKKRKKKRKI